MRLTFVFVSLLSFVEIAGAQEKDAPAAPAPHLWLASASEKDGVVIVQIAEPLERLGVRGRGGFEAGVKTLPADTVMKWHNLQTVTLGKTVQAFRVDGKRAEPRFVLATLAQPKGVAVFVRTKPDDSTSPDPFYLGIIRGDTVVLVVDRKDLYPQSP